MVDLNGQVASVVKVLPKNDLGLLEISLIVTKPWFRRRGFARAAIHKAKLLAADSGLDVTAYAENDISRDLLASEGFELVPSVENKQDHPLYRFAANSMSPAELRKREP